MLPPCSSIWAKSICTTIRPEFRVPTDLFLLYAHDHSTKTYGPLPFNLSFCARPFDQKLGSTLIYFFYLHRTIRQKHIVLFHLFFLLNMTIRPKVKIHTDLFLLFVHHHSTKIHGPHWFIFLCARDHSTKIYGILSLILSFMHDHSTKN